MSEIRYNEKFIHVLEALSSIMLKQGETFRARAYQKAQEFIMSYPTNIKTLNELKGKPNIGPAILEKLEEFISTGTLKIIERERNNPINILFDWCSNLFRPRRMFQRIFYFKVIFNNIILTIG